VKRQPARSKDKEDKQNEEMRSAHDECRSALEMIVVVAVETPLHHSRSVFNQDDIAKESEHVKIVINLNRDTISASSSHGAVIPPYPTESIDLYGYSDVTQLSGFRGTGRHHVNTWFVASFRRRRADEWGVSVSHGPSPPTPPPPLIDYVPNAVI